jgi:hypothetical protein
MTEKEKKRESRNQSRNMDSIRKKLEFMTKEYGGNFLFFSSFPNFVQQTTQQCATGEGLTFLQTSYGKYLGDQWKNHNMKLQNERFSKLMCNFICFILPLLQLIFFFLTEKKNQLKGASATEEQDSPTDSLDNVKASKTKRSKDPIVKHGHSGSNATKNMPKNDPSAKSKNNQMQRNLPYVLTCTNYSNCFIFQKQW